MSIDSRLNKLAAILRKAVNYGVDDYNPDDEEVIAPVEVVDEDISDMEELDDPKAERLELIKERHRELNRSPMMNDRARSRAEEAARLDALEEHRNTQEVDMTIPRGPGIQDVIDKRQNELEEAISSGDAQAIDTAQKNLDSAEAMRKSLEDGTWVDPNPRQKPEESTETPYDRATDTEKNREAIDEIQETLDMVDNKKKGRDRERALDIDVDDVLVLAETMYSKEEAKEALGDIDLVDLQKRVMDKYNELNTEKATAAQAIEMLYRQAGIVSAAEEKEDDPYSKFKNMTLLEKIESADYVQLYALDKLFTKQLKEKAAEAKGDEDETINPDDLQESVNSLLGKKPNDYAPGPVKKFSPEEIEAYERKMNQAASAKAKTVKAGMDDLQILSRLAQDWENGEIDELSFGMSVLQTLEDPKIPHKLDQYFVMKYRDMINSGQYDKFVEDLNWYIEYEAEDYTGASVTNKYRKARGLFEDKVCSVCGEASDCQCPGGPKIASVTNKYRTVKAAGKPFIGRGAEGDNWAVNIDGVDSAFPNMSFGRGLADRRKVEEFKEKATKMYIDAKGKPTLRSVKEFIRDNRPAQFYAKWQPDSHMYKNDSVEIYVMNQSTASVTNKPFSVREAMMSPDEHGFFADEDEGFEYEEGMTCESFSEEWDEDDLWSEMYWGDNFDAELAFDVMKADAEKQRVFLTDVDTWNYENAMWKMYNDNAEKAYSSVMNKGITRKADVVGPGASGTQ